MFHFRESCYDMFDFKHESKKRAENHEECPNNEEKRGGSNHEDFFEKQDFSKLLSGNLDILTGGVEADSKFVFVCSASGHLFALNQIDGSFGWKASISSESLVDFSKVSE